MSFAGLALLGVLVCAITLTHVIHRRILEVNQRGPPFPGSKNMRVSQGRQSVSERFELQLTDGQAALLRAKKAEQLANESLQFAREMRRQKEAAELRAAEAERRANHLIAALPSEPLKLPERQDGYKADIVTNLTKCYKLDDRRECVEPELQFRTPTRVHLVAGDSPRSGWRFQHLVNMGFKSHPAIIPTSSMTEADLIIYLPVSTREPPTAAQGATPTKLIVLDEGDGAGYYSKVKEQSYLIYLKRSWVTKRDGAYTGTGRRYTRNYFPMAYSVSDSYFDPEKTKSGNERSIDVVCSNRPTDRQPTRARIVYWVSDFLDKHSDKYRGIAGEINAAGRKEINEAYFAAMRTAKIVVTCNPSHCRARGVLHHKASSQTYDSVGEGALVFVDEMYVPHPRHFVHNEHVIVYDNSDPIDFSRKLLFYLEHPSEARRIAANGLRHALAYHRAVSRMDYVLRSAHEMASDGRASSYSFTAKQIAYDVNATTQVPPVVNISDPAINVQHIDPERNVGRLYRTTPLSSQVLTELIKRNQKRRHHVGVGISSRRPRLTGRRTRRRIVL